MMGQQGRTRVLVTAFGSFPGAPVNPTMTIVRHLEQRHRTRLSRLGVDLDVAILPVVYGDTADRLRRLLAARRPDMALHLGLAGRRKTITVEARALNRHSILRPGADRLAPQGLQIDQKSPAIRSVTLPVASIVAAIAASGAPAALSIDAGDYVCNETLYASLGLGVRAGFIHVPRARARRKRGGKPDVRPTIDAMTRAVLAAILTIVARDRNASLAARMGRAG